MLKTAFAFRRERCLDFSGRNSRPQTGALQPVAIEAAAVPCGQGCRGVLLYFLCFELVDNLERTASGGDRTSHPICQHHLLYESTKVDKQLRFRPFCP
jgi:hypothetical protein